MKGQGSAFVMGLDDYFLAWQDGVSSARRATAFAPASSLRALIVTARAPALAILAAGLKRGSNGGGGGVCVVGASDQKDALVVYYCDFAVFALRTDGGSSALTITLNWIYFQVLGRLTQAGT